MITATTNPSRPGLVHDALFYDSEDVLAADIAPFLYAGLGDGEAVLIACGEANQALLVDELDGDRDLVVVPREEIHGHGSAGAPMAWLRRLRQPLAAGELIRMVVDARPATGDWTDWCREEAVDHHLLAAYPIWVVCLYDTRSTPADALDAAVELHPHLRRDGRRLANPGCVSPELVLRRHAPVRRDPLTLTRPTLCVDDFTDRGLLRNKLHVALGGHPNADPVLEDFATAIDELVSNAVRHGRPPAVLRLWLEPHRLLCTVTDSGTGFDDPFAGYLPASSGTGLGLWFCRQRCDAFDAYADPAGFTVQISRMLPD